MNILRGYESEMDLGKIIIFIRIISLRHSKYNYMKSWEEASEGELVELIEKGEYEKVKGIAVNELSEVFDVESMGLISVEIADDESDYSGLSDIEERTIIVPESVDLEFEPEWVSEEYIQAAAIFESVAHILAEDAFYEKSGEFRDRGSDLSLWYFVADEMLDSIPRWGEKWSFERSYQKADEEFQQEVDNSDEELVLSHILGYKLSQYAYEQDYEPSRLVRMSYDELRSEFNEAFTEIKDEVEERYDTSIQFV